MCEAKYKYENKFIMEHNKPQDNFITSFFAKISVHECFNNEMLSWDTVNSIFYRE